MARHYGVTDGNHKLIRLYELEGNKLDDWELFDLKKDPNELQSVYGSTDYVEVQGRLENQLTVARERFGVPETDPVRQRKNKKRNPQANSKKKKPAA